MAYLQAFFGLTILIFAGDFLVRGAVGLAKRSGISKLAISLTIVAFGTSAPELLVGIKAVLSDAGALAIGNVVGSNIANVLLVVGIPALIAPIACTAPRLTRNIIIMLTASAIFFGMASSGNFAWEQGMVLVFILISFLTYSALRAKAHPNEPNPIEDEIQELEAPPEQTWMTVLMVIGGSIGLAFGADLLVDGSMVIASDLGISEEVIGLTLVAIGTSLPELVTAIVAALKKHHDVVVGNVIGSNIFNILGIIGISSFFGDIPVADHFIKVDLWVMIAASIAILPFAHFRASIGRSFGFVLLTAYAGYMFYLSQVSGILGS